MQQGRITQPTGRRAEQTGQRQIIGRISDRAQGIQQIAHLWPIVKALPGDGHIGNARAFESVLISGEARRGAEQQRQVSPLHFFVVVQFMQALRQRCGCRATTGPRVFADTQCQFDKWLLHHRWGRSSIRHQRGKRHFKCSGRFDCSEDRLK